MKLGTLFALSGQALSEWVQPTWQEVMQIWSTRSNQNWGAPIVGRAAAWQQCPRIDPNAIDGAKGLRCNGATCALACEGGYIARGRRRTKCRKNRRKGIWYWKNQLGTCQTCDVWDPVANDPLVSTVCKINEGTNRRWCKMSCPPTHTIADSKGSFVKIACKCMRHQAKCGWAIRNKTANYQNYKCHPKATPEPITEPDGSGSGAGSGDNNGWPDGLTENDNGNTFIPGK